MADGFGTAIYTNCAPGQGIDRVAGMQWQARSEGIGRDVLDVVRKHLIYEPPRVASDALAVTDYPVSFAHVSDGILATASGIYLGREAVGNRRGNHLTNAVITTDPDAYRSVRPAQLFGASFWRTAPADSTSSAPVPDTWTPGPLDAAALGRYVADQPRGTELLAALLTALKYPDSIGNRRIVFIGTEVQPIVTWFAAATLLLPQARAVRIGFKFFTADPARSALEVVAVHPRWSTFPATVENDLGYAIFDLERGRWSEIPVHPEARRWVGLFADEDPYDVSEAVELAAASGLTGDAAFELAGAGVLTLTPSAMHAEALLRWLTTGPAALREAYGGTVLTALGASSDPAVLARCDEVGAVAYPERRDEVRLRWLQAELGQAPGRPGGSASGALPPMTLSSEVAARARDEVAARLATARGPAFDNVLRVAKRFAVPVDLAEVRPAVLEFVADWVRDPARSYDPDQWPADLPVLDLARDEVARRLAEQPADWRRVGDRWWRILWTGERRTLDPHDPVDRMLAAAAMAHSPPGERLGILRDLLSRDGPRLRDQAAVLWSRTAMTADEAFALTVVLRPGTDLGREPFTELLGQAERSELAAVDACGRLRDRRLLALPPAIAEQVSGLRLLEETAERISTRLLAPTEDTGRRLARLPARLVGGFAPRLVQALWRLPDLVVLDQALTALPDEIAAEFLRTWPERMDATPLPAWMATAFYLAQRSFPGPHARATADGIRPEIRRVLETFADRGSDKEIADAGRRLSGLPAAYGDTWKNLVSGRRPGSATGHLLAEVFRLFRGPR